MKDGRWVQVAASQFDHEKKGLAAVKELLPDAPPYRAWANFEFRDNPPRTQNRRNPSVSAGDLLLITSRLLNQENSRVGRLDAVCTATGPGRTFNRAHFHCSGTYTLSDGSLALSAAFKGSEENAPIAVVGGTGAYEGAHGSVTSRNLPRDRTESTVHISP